MRIWPKMRLWKLWILKKCDFEIVNFVKNEIFKMWILWKVRLWKCEFLDKLRVFAPVCLNTVCPNKKVANTHFERLSLIFATDDSKSKILIGILPI